MKLLKTHVWFYKDGWRYGRIIKKLSENRMTVADCLGCHIRITRSPTDKWVAASGKEFKAQKILDKRNKKKVKIKKCFKVKLKRKKL
jgi:hypothetical protein